jgi:hypothetical protein
MADDFSDLHDFIDDAADDGGFWTPPVPSLAHPNGKQYRIPSPTALVGMRLTALADIAMKSNKGVEVAEADVMRLRISDEDERGFAEQVLGEEALEAMIADDVSWTHVKRITTFAFTYFAVSPESARKAAEAGLLSGKVQAPNRAQRRAKATTTGSAATKTPRKPSAKGR